MLLYHVLFLKFDKNVALAAQYRNRKVRMRSGTAALLVSVVLGAEQEHCSSKHSMYFS
jgi:hypothetical protein